MEKLCVDPLACVVVFRSHSGPLTFLGLIFTAIAGVCGSLFRIKSCSKLMARWTTTTTATTKTQNSDAKLKQHSWEDVCFSWKKNRAESREVVISQMISSALNLSGKVPRKIAPACGLGIWFARVLLPDKFSASEFSYLFSSCFKCVSSFPSSVGSQFCKGNLSYFLSQPLYEIDFCAFGMTKKNMRRKYRKACEDHGRKLLCNLVWYFSRLYESFQR